MCVELQGGRAAPWRPASVYAGMVVGVVEVVDAVDAVHAVESCSTGRGQAQQSRPTCLGGIRAIDRGLDDGRHIAQAGRSPYPLPRPARPSPFQPSSCFSSFRSVLARASVGPGGTALSGGGA